MGVSLSACRMAYTICSSENFDRFIEPLLSSRTAEAAILLSFSSAVVFRGDVITMPHPSQEVRMPQSKFTEIGSILKEADAGRPVNEMWHNSPSSTTYCNWNAK